MDSGFDNTKMDPRFSILSPRQTPSLLTSVSQIMTPSRVPHIYSFSQQRNPILNHLAQHVLSTPECSLVGNDTKNMPGGKSSKPEPIERDIFSERYVRAKSEPVNIEDDTKRSLNVTYRNNSEYSELPLETLERQIIKDTPTLTDGVNSKDCTDANIYLPTHVQTRNPVHHEMTIKELGGYSHTETPIYTYHRSHSSSVSSNADTNQHTSLSTRCSDCDGCSSSGSSNHPLHVDLPACNYQQLSGFSDRRRNCSEGSSFSTEVDSYMYKKTRDNTCMGLVSANMDVDISNITHSNRSANVSLHKHDTYSPKRPQCQLNPYPGHGQSTLGHAVVLATWIQLSKIKELQNENVKQRQTMTECKRKVDNLILSVLVLSKQMKSSVCRLQSNHVYLDQIKEAQKQYECKLKRLHYGFACLAVLYVLQLSSFRNRCLSVIRFFGILELISKINRTRKMISKNWWNIPSLLTDFWRIFIFRSRSRLRDRFS